MSSSLESMQLEIDSLRTELRIYRMTDSNSGIYQELKQLKDEFRKFLEYSKVKLSYEQEPDLSEPDSKIKTLLKFRPAND